MKNEQKILVGFGIGHVMVSDTRELRGMVYLLCQFSV
jgi:hypothetical protein